MTARAVLFDVGGPLDLEIEHERLVDAAIRAAVARRGYPSTDAAFAAAAAWAVDSFAPDTYAAMTWRLCGGDVRATEAALIEIAAGRDAAATRRGGIELRPGIAELLARLHAAGVRLGLAANQPQRVVAELDRHGIGQLFAHREVTGHHGLRKPDVRLFLRACDDLGVEPAACVMVGDRIDNDIAPARLLGMRTVLYRTGRHIAQRPRSLDEVPDREVHTVPELESALTDLRTAPSSQLETT